MQGPEPYLRDMGADLACPVDSAQRAIIDTAHRAFVNYEVYYFSSAAALEEFVSRPYHYTGKVTDPVARTRFQPTERSLWRSYGGRLFYFQSAATAAKFDRSPDTFGSLQPTMSTM